MEGDEPRTATSKGTVGLGTLSVQAQRGDLFESSNSQLDVTELFQDTPKSNVASGLRWAGRLTFYLGSFR